MTIVRRNTDHLHHLCAQDHVVVIVVQPSDTDRNEDEAPSRTIVLTMLIMLSDLSFGAHRRVRNLAPAQRCRAPHVFGDIPFELHLDVAHLHRGRIDQQILDRPHLRAVSAAHIPPANVRLAIGNLEIIEIVEMHQLSR